MKHLNNFKTYESMVHQNSLDQMKRVADMLNGMDIGDRVEDASFANAVDTVRNVAKDHVQTYAEYLEEPFDDNQNRKPWSERRRKE